jgi:hypothetical protein
MHFNVKENNGQRLYEIQFDDEEQSKDFSIDEQLYEELFNMSANIQLNILKLLSEHVVRVLKAKQEQSQLPKS